MHKTSFLQEFAAPAAAFVLFFVLEALGGMSELGLTVFVAGVSTVLFYWNSRIKEVYLFAIGALAGLVIEVGLRFLGYQQVWKDASLFGVPFWLPLAWGMGFVLITRLGIYIRGIKFRN